MAAVLPRTDSGEAGRVEGDRERFGQRSLDEGHLRRQRDAIPFRGQNVFGHAPGELAEVAEEEELATSVRPSRPALVARAAGDGRLDDDRVARLDPRYGTPDLFDDPGAFVPGDERVGHAITADAIREIIVKIAAADAHDLAPDENVVVADDPGRRDLADLDRPDAGEECGFHGFPIIK